MQPRPNPAHCHRRERLGAETRAAGAEHHQVGEVAAQARRNRRQALEIVPARRQRQYRLGHDDSYENSNQLVVINEQFD